MATFVYMDFDTLLKIFIFKRNINQKKNEQWICWIPNYNCFDEKDKKITNNKQTRISSKKVQIFNETTRSGFMRNFKVIIFEIFGPNLNVPSKIEKINKFI